jgi:nucleoside 2-deoxyribosyltransferase
MYFKARSRYATDPNSAILRRVRLYFAGPLFTTAERAWNVEMTEGLRAAGHEIFLPQEQEVGDAAAIFATDVAGIDWSEGLVAIMDGPDADAGTAWEVGYAFAKKKPIVLVHTDIRATAGPAGPYSPMLTQAGTTQLEMPAATTDEVLAAVLDALAEIARNSDLDAPA